MDTDDLVHRANELARSESSVAGFYQYLLPAIVRSLRAVSVTLWRCSGEGIELVRRHGQQIDLDSRASIRDRHDALLAQARDAGQPAFVPAGAGRSESANPFDFVLGICPVRIGDEVVALIETFADPDIAEQQRNDNVRLLNSVAGIAGRFHADCERQRLHAQQDWWEQFENFITASNRSLDLDDTCCAVANEGRVVIGCDRVSVALRRGQHIEIQSVSGQESVNRRANTIVALEELAACVITTGETLRFPDDATPFTEPLDSALKAYVDLAQPRELSVLPLKHTSGNGQASDVIGALVVEQFRGESPAPELTQAVGRHAAMAVSNALDYSDVFLLPLWRSIGRFRRQYLSKAALAAAGLLVAALVLTFVPADFKLTAEGTLQPQERRHVFASESGVVDDLPVRHGSRVEAGQILARLRSSELELQMAEVLGELHTTGRKLTATRAARAAGYPMSTSSAVPGNSSGNHLAVEEVELRQWLESLEIQQKLLTDRSESLTLRSPLKGQVVTWDVENRLKSRPVSRGDVLLTIADTDGPWVLELLLADRRAGHLREALRQMKPELDVTFMLETNPGQELRGQIQEVGQATIVDETLGLCVPVTVRFDQASISEPLSGASVVARIHCGRRSLGYVWLHGVWEFVQSRILFHF